MFQLGAVDGILMDATARKFEAENQLPILAVVAFLNHMGSTNGS